MVETLLDGVAYSAAILALEALSACSLGAVHNLVSFLSAEVTGDLPLEVS